MPTSKRTTSANRKRVLAALARPRAVGVRIVDRRIFVDLTDGRVVRCARNRFPKLAGATLRELRDWRLIGPGIGIRWESLDEDVSVMSLVSPKSSPLVTSPVR